MRRSAQTFPTHANRSGSIIARQPQSRVRPPGVCVQAPDVLHQKDGGEIPAGGQEGHPEPSPDVQLQPKVPHLAQCRRTPRHLRGPGEAGGEPHQRLPPPVVPQPGRRGRRPRARALHRHRSLPDGVRVQHRRVGAAVLRRPLPARLRPPRRPGSRRPVHGLRRVREVVTPRHEAVRRDARRPDGADRSVRGHRQALPSGAAPRHRGHQHHRPLTDEPRMQARPAQNAVLPPLSGRNRHSRVDIINLNGLMEAFTILNKYRIFSFSFQGLTQSKPCMGYCLNVMRGCLASMAEIDIHWREFVHSLEGLSARMHGPQDLEQVLLGAHTLLRDAIGHAQKNAARLSAQVHRMCGPPSRKSAESVSAQQGSSRESIPLKTPVRGTGDSLAVKRRDFLNNLRMYRTHYGGLADQLCVSELASGDGLSCWNGIDAVKSYTLRVVGSGIKAQSTNPEVKVKGVDPVVNQIIDKLKHINQLLQGKSIPKLGSLDQIETGSGDAEGQYSGDCDDEDGCGSSGGGESRRKNSRVVKLSPDVAADQNHHHHHRRRPPVEERELKGRSGSLGLTAALWGFVLPWLHTLRAL
uniref:Glypican 5a n=1 Tax=Takifugu rubripes TaxID=31033 RepID=A0A3B5KEY3_TAKRU